MKKLIFIFIFLMIPVVFLNAQDIKEKKSTEIQTLKVFYKEISCPDCQGWGWILGEGLKLKNASSVSGSGYMNSPNPGRTVYSGYDRHKCMYCNGSGKILAKFIER